MAKTLYDILEVSPAASVDTITAAYRSLISRYHPDKVATLGQDLRDLAAQRATEINTAYQTLKDEKQRAAYDASIRAGQSEARHEEAPERAKHAERGAEAPRREQQASYASAEVMPGPPSWWPKVHLFKGGLVAVTGAVSIGIGSLLAMLVDCVVPLVKGITPHGPILGGLAGILEGLLYLWAIALCAIFSLGGYTLVVVGLVVLVADLTCSAQTNGQFRRFVLLGRAVLGLAAALFVLNGGTGLAGSIILIAMTGALALPETARGCIFSIFKKYGAKKLGPTATGLIADGPDGSVWAWIYTIQMEIDVWGTARNMCEWHAHLARRECMAWVDRRASEGDQASVEFWHRVADVVEQIPIKDLHKKSLYKKVEPVVGVAIIVGVIGYFVATKWAEQKGITLTNPRDYASAAIGAVGDKEFVKGFVDQLYQILASIKPRT